MSYEDYATPAYLEMKNENAKLRKRITILEKRWKALRKYLRSYLPGALFPVQVTNKMTKITRKIK